MRFVYAHLKLMQSYYTDNTLLHAPSYSEYSPLKSVHLPAPLIIRPTAPQGNEGRGRLLFRENGCVGSWSAGNLSLFVYKDQDASRNPSSPFLLPPPPLTRIPTPPRERWVGSAIITYIEVIYTT